MSKLSKTLLALVFNAVCVTGAGAAVMSLTEWASHQDGVVVDHALFPSEVFTSRNVTLSFSGVGGHVARLFIDAEIDLDSNPFWNEYGATSGTLASGQSWEIDEPGWVFGDIYTHFSTGNLENANAIPSGSEDDVAMALGWNFNLTAGQTAEANFFLSTVAPTSGFYLIQTDPDSAASLYFYSTLDIHTPSPSTNPEPPTALLLLPVLAGLLLTRRKAA